MGNYRNFSLATYFIAQGTARTTQAELEKDIAFFARHLRLDKVYVEPFRGGLLASSEQIEMVKACFAAQGIATEGGLTPTIHNEPSGKPKQRMYDTFCYTDETMLAVLREAVARIAKHFDSFIIDDFFFTNCTCATCRGARDTFNSAQGVTDGSWEAFRMDLMRGVSIDVLKTARQVNPGIQVVIKYPNWMESFQETGYNPAEQKQLFDGVYTGTETRDPIHTDQHLPRYLSYSLMRHFEAMCPGKNGGGWFDPYDCLTLNHYLEQAYLTAFSKPKELMMFCFQSLVDTVNIPALGFMLDRLDETLDHLGDCVAIPCYIPDNSQGEDNLHDFLGMAGLPVATTPYFPEHAPVMLLTRSSAKDPAIVEKLEPYVAAGGKAIVTSGFLEETLERGMKRLTSARIRGRKIMADAFAVEGDRPQQMTYWRSPRPIAFPLVEFRNNASWALAKAVVDEENYAILLRDTYGDGAVITLAVPDMYADIRQLPAAVLTRLRKECSVNGIYLEGGPEIGLFVYDNDTVLLYPFVGRDAQREEILLHVCGAKALRQAGSDGVIEPLYARGEEVVFALDTRPGVWQVYKIVRYVEEK
ncbi:MAG: permease [Clostridia bacterium]|nr:permease [Clostridia bacterium]